MTTTTKTAPLRLRFDRNAYQFVFDALRQTQQKVGRGASDDPDDESAHITGRELLEGIRELALEEFGLLARTVFRHWGVHSTADFGRIVFDLVETGQMRATDRDHISDFFDVYDFDEAFDGSYRIRTSKAFRR